MQANVIDPLGCLPALLERKPNMKMKTCAALAVSAAFALALSGCAAGNVSSNQNAASGEATQGGSGQQKIEVVASFYPMYDFAKKIGGERVEVTNLVPAGTEPHDWEPSSADMKTIASADILVANGAGMEHWLGDVTSSSGNESLTVVTASDGIDLLQSADEEEEEAHGNADEGDAVDPHVWLNPENAKTEMANIRDALVKADPDGASEYKENYADYAKKLDDLDAEFKSKLAKTSSKDLVVSHQAFGYLCKAYGLTQVPIEGLEADSEPDAKTMSEIIDFVKENNVKTIFGEELVSRKTAQAIADATGASCEVLNPIEGLTDEQLADGEDYFSVMKSNLDELVKALS